MATFNGEKYIAEQLDSLAAQTYENWYLIVSDDGSTDRTIAILQKHQQLWGAEKLEIRQRSQSDFAQNFLALACCPSIRADFYAFCDQDDVWLPEKLQVAIAYLDSLENPEVPHVYCGRTAYVRDNLKPYAYSPEFVFPRTFRNALIQSIAGGNTMVFNPPTKILLEKVGPVPTPSHDWWLYQLVTGTGGVMHYDAIPHVLYRQHSGALVGGNNSFWAKVERMAMVLNGRFKAWSEQNIQCLQMAYPYLTESSQEILGLFIKMRLARFKDRFRLLEVCGLYRQTWRGTLSLMLAALIKRV